LSFLNEVIQNVKKWSGRLAIEVFLLARKNGGSYVVLHKIAISSSNISQDLVDMQNRPQAGVD
jgi:hypothetical protein